MAKSFVTITLNDNGGSGGTSKLYYGDSGNYKNHWYTSTSPSSWINYVTKLPTAPTRACFTYAGHWTSKSGGSRVIREDRSLNTFSFTAATTIYAHWTRLSYILALELEGGTGGTTHLYNRAGDGGWYTTWQCENEATSVTPPTRSGYIFRGFYSGQNGTGTKYINADGTFTDTFRYLTITATTYIYAHWAASNAVTVDADGGTGGTATFYYVPDATAFFADAAGTQEITAITPPVKSGALFLGCYDASTGGNLIVAQDGTIDSSYAPNAAATIYARWRTIVTVELDAGNGDGGDESIIYDSADTSFHRPGGGDAISAIDPPTWECHRFNGYVHGGTGTTCIDGTGALLPALYALDLSADLTLVASWTLVSYKATVEMAGGGGDVESFYSDGSTSTFYQDDLLTVPLDTFPLPTRTGYNFSGVYDAATGGNLAISADGEFLLGPFTDSGGGMSPLSDAEASLTLYARWTAKSYTLSFNYNGGSGSPAFKVVTWGQAIGTLPTPTRPANRPDATFDGWKLNGEILTAATIWQRDGDATATAAWLTAFSSVVDYFNMASAYLIPISSDAGDDRQRVAVAHYGRHEADVTASGGIWRNPTVTYAVVKNVTLAVTLGRAYKGSSGVSGYMITTVEVTTEVGKFPTVTISATANEGANAINLFPVSVSIVARSKAQNLLNGVSGGGYLQRASLVATCDPVVCEENMMPCASDVVNGRLELSAETLAAVQQAAPTTGNGFALIGAPKATKDADYMRYSLTARKEMT